MPRLLHAETRQFKEFIGDSVPPYAILSHTWGANELTFKDVQGLTSSDQFPADPKLDGCCTRALQDGYEYIWIDTICIDKSSSAELSEAINSMFDWYFDSAVCYAYLSDVPPGGDPLEPDSAFRKSRWFTRGWTLQELLAPHTVLFFDSQWNYIGEKRLDGAWEPGKDDRVKLDRMPPLLKAVAAITNIPASVLGSAADRVFKFKLQTIAERMLWACKRQVTRKEDEAYSLLGIFQINMPLLYGEGENAFQRLQHELIKVSDDETLFAWGFMPVEDWPQSSLNTYRGNLLAPSLRHFQLPDGVRITRWRYGTGQSNGIRSGHYLLTNKGILLNKPVQSGLLSPNRRGASLHLIPLMCSLAADFTESGKYILALLMQSDPRDPNKYSRVIHQPVSVPSGVFGSARAMNRNLYASESQFGSVVRPSMICRITRPRIQKSPDAELGIRLTSFYPPTMQALNRSGVNTLLVRHDSGVRWKKFEREFWANWTDKLRPGMEDTVYFVSFDGTLGSFVVMIFPVYNNTGDGGSDDDELPFLPEEPKTKVHDSETRATHNTNDGRPTSRKEQDSSTTGTGGTWQFRVARLPRPPRHITVKDKFQQITKGKKAPQPSARTCNILDASVDIRQLPWTTQLPCKRVGTLDFTVTGNVSEGWSLEMELDIDWWWDHDDLSIKELFNRWKSLRAQRIVAGMTFASVTSSVVSPRGSIHSRSTDADYSSSSSGTDSSSGVDLSS